MFENVSSTLEIMSIFSFFHFENIALLSGTLRTFQKTTCDSERVSLSCPRGTSISIELAQYEKNGIGLYQNTQIVYFFIKSAVTATGSKIMQFIINLDFCSNCTSSFVRWHFRAATFSLSIRTQTQFSNKQAKSNQQRKERSESNASNLVTPLSAHIGCISRVSCRAKCNF